MNFRNRRIIAPFLLAATLLLSAAGGAIGQKAEHYSSPLYSPRKYDPTVSEATGLPDALQKIGIEQKLGAQLPLNSQFKDENGAVVRLGDYFKTGRPVIVAFVYYECPMLCNQVLNGLTGALKGVSLEPGKDFEVIAISFDAREYDSSDIVRNKKLSYMERYGRPGTEKGWHFLTGQQSSIDQVTSAAGFSYKWDEKTNQFAHAAAIMVATPDGRLSRYHYGIDYAPRDVKFSLMESAESKVGNAADKLLLYCYHYDPASGKYGLAILNVIRLGGVVTMLGMGLMAFVFWRRSKKKDHSADGV